MDKVRSGLWIVYTMEVIQFRVSVQCDEGIVG